MPNRMLAVVTLAALTLSVNPAGAQQKGEFFVGGHLGQAMGSEITIKSVDGVPVGEKFETKSGMGFGLLGGYSFGGAFGLYGILTQATQDIKNSTDDVTLRHLGAGVRYTMAGSPKFRPYFALEGGQRRVSGEQCDASGCTDLVMTGIYFGGGAGGLYTFQPALAFDASLNVSTGSFTDIEAGGVSGDLKTDSPMNIRIQLGVTWFPARKKTP